MSTKHGSRWLEREDIGDITVVRLQMPKALPEETIRTVFDLIYSLIDNIGRNKLVLNLAAVAVLPSMALGKLVMLNRKVQVANGRLVLCQLTPTVIEVLETTHLKELFSRCNTEQEALQSFS